MLDTRDVVFTVIRMIGIIILIILIPLGLLWSLNTLFGLGIAYTFKMWTAALVLLLVLQRGPRKEKDD